MKEILQHILDGTSGWRKVLVIFALLFIATALLIGHQISADHWVDLLKFCIPSFLAANLGEHLLEGRKGA